MEDLEGAYGALNFAMYKKTPFHNVPLENVVAAFCHILLPPPPTHANGFSGSPTVNVMLRIHLLVIEGRKKMFYLKTRSTHFIYGYMASDIW